MTPISQAFDQALAFHQAGDFQQAERYYRYVLQADSQHADAFHLLGVLCQQTGRSDLAVAYIGEAVRLRPNFPEAHANLGSVFGQLGRLDEAVASLRQALQFNPNYAEAYNNLGNAYREQKKLDEAVTALTQCLRLKSQDTEALNNLGLAYQEQGKLDEAIGSYREALRLRPGYAEAFSNLGVAYREQGKLDESIGSYREALRLRPGYAEAHSNLGVAYQEQGRLDEAIGCYREALRLRPGYAEAYSNLGLAYQGQGKLDDAVGCYREALRLQPGHVMAHSNLALAYQEQGKLDDAEASLRQALRLHPGYVEAQANLGNVLKDQGRLDDAIAAYRTATRTQAERSGHAQQPHLRVTLSSQLRCRALWEECRRWNQQHAEPLKRFILPHANHPDPDRRLRIGYVSDDFRNHAISFFTIPLLSSHDHRQFEIYCYAHVARPDVFTERLRGYANVWRNTVGLSDQQIAELVRSDRIDILIDLKLHTANNRLGVFARKPAPVQVTWLGYPGTTGLSAIDYRLTDPYIDPPGLFDAFCAEETVRLPDTFWCYDPLTEEQGTEVNDLPALESGVITLGCLNNFCKINDKCLALWAKVLQAVPRSRLLLLAPRGQAREHVLARLQQEGIASARVEFADKQSRLEYLKMYNRIDFGLDPLPYNGHTTSMDAFWMGVPVITLLGKTTVGRAGWSQLCNLGLKDLAAETPEQYVALAAQLAADLPRLQELRGTLRQRMLRSPLMDANRFARHMEQAYRQMWRRWCKTDGAS